MVGSALILLREGLEAALIVAIVLAYLRKLDRRDRFGTVWLGTGIALTIAAGAGVALFLTVGSLEGDARRWTFALIMALAAAVLTWMIFWMRSQARAIRGELQVKVDPRDLQRELQVRQMERKLEELDALRKRDEDRVRLGPASVHTDDKFLLLSHAHPSRRPSNSWNFVP